MVEEDEVAEAAAAVEEVDHRRERDICVFEKPIDK